MIIAIFLFIIIAIIFIYYNYYQENFTNTSTANEALQTISSVFNNQNMTLSNLTTTGNITSAGIISSYADIGPNTGGSVFGHSNKTQSIGLGYNTIYAAGTSPNQDIQLQSKGTGSVVLLPGTGSVYVYGNTNLKGNVNIDGTLTIGGVPITASGGSVTIGGNIILRNNMIYIKQDGKNAPYIQLQGPVRSPNIAVDGNGDPYMTNTGSANGSAVARW